LKIEALANCKVTSIFFIGHRNSACFDLSPSNNALVLTISAAFYKASLKVIMHVSIHIWLVNIMCWMNVLYIRSCVDLMNHFYLMMERLHDLVVVINEGSNSLNLWHMVWPVYINSITIYILTFNLLEDHPIRYKDNYFIPYLSMIWR
jgi:hypothetical protein